MNSQEAKFILQAYRHSGRDAQDPQMAEALAQAQRDPELSRWVAQDQELFHLMSRAVKDIPVPSGLKDSILAGRKVIHPPVWWRQPAWLGAAAALLLLCSLVGLQVLKSGPGSFAGYLEFTTDYLTVKLEKRGLGMVNENQNVLKAYLSTQGAPATFILPAGLGELPAVGCQVLDWHQNKISLLCLRGNGSSVLHLTIMDRPEGFRLPDLTEPQFAQSGFWMTASWAQDDKVFVLAGRGREDALRQYL